MKKKSIIAPILVATLLTTVAFSEEAISPVIDGMTLSLGDYVQQVSVRAKSLGPGACGVTFRISGESNSFIAPPLSWSEWVNLDPAFIGESAQELGFTIGCDTGAVAEVKYER